MKTQHLRSRSIRSKVQKIVLTWLVDEPMGKRSRQRRLKSKKNPSYIGHPKFWIGCCCTVVFFLVARYLIMGYSERVTISMQDHKVYESESQSKLQSVDENTVLGPSYDSKQHLKPNPNSLNPSDWDLSFAETQIHLKAWTKSFEKCFFEKKLSNEEVVEF